MGVYKDKKSGKWVYKFQSGGRSYGKRGFKTKREAEIARSERRKEVEATPEPVELDNGFREVAYEYLDVAKRQFAFKTFEVKRHVYKSFLEHLGANLPITQITIQQIESYLRTRPSNNNFNIHRKELLVLFNFAKKRKYLAENVVEDIPKLPHTPKRKVIPSEQQILQLINACDPELDRPMFLTILHTLGRVDEVLRLTWEDVNFEKRTVTLWTRKRKGGSYEADPMPMNQDLYDTLFSLYKRRTQERWVFLNPMTGTRFLRRPKFMKKLCRRAFDPGCKNIDDYTGPVFGFHTLRHFMASWLADQGKWSTKTLQRLLRHKEARTTEIYLHSIGDGLREAMESVQGVFRSEKSVAGECGGFDSKSRHKSENAASGAE